MKLALQRERNASIEWELAQSPHSLTMLVWSSQYTTGVPLVDSQHKVLFENINRLEELVCMQPIPRTELERVMHFLESYSTSHFSFEEQCMHRHSCPSHEENMREHAQFRDMVAVYKQEYADRGATQDFLVRFHAYLHGWLHCHVLDVDVKLRSAVTAVTVNPKQV